MTVRPVLKGQRLLVKPLEAAEATAHGIVLPQEARQRESRGVVVAVGQPRSEYLWSEAPAEVGDVVVWDGRTGRRGNMLLLPPVEVTLDLDETGHQEQFVILDFGDVLLVLDDVSVEARERK